MKISRRDAVKLITGSLPAYYLSSVLSSRVSDAAEGTQENVLLTLGEAAKTAVPSDYLGFSCETAQLADPTFFDPENHELVSLFKELTPEGILRLGGNSSEFCWWKTSPDDKPPELPESAHRDDNWMPHSFTAIEPKAVDNLAGFLETTGWEVIYNLNLGTGTPERDAEEAAYVAKKLGKKLLYFQIGNEPEYYKDSNNRLRSQDWNFDKYLAQWVTFAKAVIARVPDAKFGGPDVGSNTQWVTRFAQEAPRLLPGRIVACNGHYYVMGPPDDPRSTVERLLAPDRRVDRDVPRIISIAEENHLVYRMTEGNSCYRGGKPGVSNAFCSSLWAADYLLKLASFGCAGRESSWRRSKCYSPLPRRAFAWRETFPRSRGYRDRRKFLHSNRRQSGKRLLRQANLLRHEVSRHSGRRSNAPGKLR